MVKEFHIPIGSLLAMPKKHFFWLSNMAPRVRAEQDLRLLNVLLVSQSSQESVQTVWDGIRQVMGVVYESSHVATKTFKVQDENEMDPEFDRAGLRALKAKHGA